MLFTGGKQREQKCLESFEAPPCRAYPDCQDQIAKFSATEETCAVG